MPFCRNCGSQMTDTDRFCQSCGSGVDSTEPAEVSTPARSSGSASGGAWMSAQVLGLVGFIMLAIGPFMAWATAGIFSVSGLQKTGNEAVILVVLGTVGAILTLVSLLNKKSVLSLVTLIAAIVGLAITIYYFVALLDDLSWIENDFFTPGMGGGIYLCLVGGVLALIGAVIGGLLKNRG